MRATAKAGSATEWAESIDGAPPGYDPGAPLPEADVTPAQQREVERFLFRQAEILDDKKWDAWMALFADDGKYWMPVSERDTTGDGVPSIFYEDIDLMKVRIKRVTHPRAWSQKPPHKTSHVVSNVVVESIDAKTGDAVVRSKFYMSEFRRDVTRHFAGKYRHHLRKTPAGYRIALQRVDLVNGEGTFDYVIQTWV
jgi:3-phenylpropionate/cinnamic acid dioxygenase small subunit